MEGVVDGEGVAVKDAFKWGGGGGSLGHLSRNISKQGVGKGKSWGGGFEGVTTPVLPRKF